MLTVQSVCRFCGLGLKINYLNKDPIFYFPSNYDERLQFSHFTVVCLFEERIGICSYKRCIDRRRSLSFERKM